MDSNNYYQNFRFQNQANPFWQTIMAHMASESNPEAFAATFDGNQNNNQRDLPYHGGPPGPTAADDGDAPPAPGPDDPSHPHHGPPHGRHCGGPHGHGHGHGPPPGRGGPWGGRGGCRGRGGFGGPRWGAGGPHRHGGWGGPPFGRWGGGPPGPRGGMPLEGLAGMFGVGEEQVKAFKEFMAQQFGVPLDGDARDAAAAGTDDFTPPADVFDTPEAYVVHVSVPGAKKEDVGVNWDADRAELNVAGVIYRPADEETLKTLAVDERDVGAFARKIKLGAANGAAVSVDSDGITAKMQDGVLIVRVPKVEEFVEVKKVDIE